MATCGVQLNMAWFHVSGKPNETVGFGVCLHQQPHRKSSAATFEPWNPVAAFLEKSGFKT
jgi:hypothetical protein